jgi:hypothetical protein
MDTATAALISASLATTGWLYAARRARVVSKKQHTVSVMLHASFNRDFQNCIKLMRPFLVAQNLPATFENQDELRESVRIVLNHYEFIAAGLRNGDFDESLMRDSERGAIIQLYAGCKNFIWALRDNRDRMSIYEHLEWLYDRWTDKVAHPIVDVWEWIIGFPIQGARHKHKK